MELFLQIYGWCTIIVFVFLVIGIKAYQFEDYDNAEHDDKWLILWAKHKQPLLIVIMAIASLFWGILLPAIFILALIQKEEV
jgi:nitrogen fixation-related uncharacterized protein